MSERVFERANQRHGAGAWLDDLTGTFLAAVDTVPDDGFTVPTALPGWTRAHVIAHVHFNALALQRLVHWARTEHETPMYADRTQRAAQIEQGASETPARLRTLVHDSADALRADLADLTPAALERTIVTAQGRRLPASEIAWLRCPRARRARHRPRRRRDVRRPPRRSGDGARP